MAARPAAPLTRGINIFCARASWLLKHCFTRLHLVLCCAINDFCFGCLHAPVELYHRGKGGAILCVEGSVRHPTYVILPLDSSGSFSASSNSMASPMSKMPTYPVWTPGARIRHLYLDTTRRYISVCPTVRYPSSASFYYFSLHAPLCL